LQYFNRLLANATDQRVIVKLVDSCSQNVHSTP